MVQIGSVQATESSIGAEADTVLPGSASYDVPLEIGQAYGGHSPPAGLVEGVGSLSGIGQLGAGDNTPVKESAAEALASGPSPSAEAEDMCTCIHPASAATITRVVLNVSKKSNIAAAARSTECEQISVVDVADASFRTQLSMEETT